jgi:hypothetical protein
MVPPPDLTTVILTSAVVSGSITAVFGFIGQTIERRARRKELIFTKSVELAKANRDYMLQLGQDMGGGVTIHDYVPYAEVYHWLLTERESKGKLPKNWQGEIKSKFPILAK